MTLRMGSGLLAAALKSGAAIGRATHYLKDGGAARAKRKGAPLVVIVVVPPHSPSGLGFLRGGGGFGWRFLCLGFLFVRGDDVDARCMLDETVGRIDVNLHMCTIPPTVCAIHSMVGRIHIGAPDSSTSSAQW